MKHSETILAYWDDLYPNPKGELWYRSPFELLIAVMLSAQTTDKAVNLATPTLFAQYPSIESLASAKIEDIESLIRHIGLYKTKAKHLIETATILLTDFQGQVPSTLEDLIRLPGVGRKTASVVLIEGFGIPAFPVDTHVARVSKRLGLAKEKDTPLQIEMKLRKLMDPSTYHKRHHQMILFGRYHCKAIRPYCDICQIQPICKYKKEAK